MCEPVSMKCCTNIDQYQLDKQHIADPFEYANELPIGFFVFHRMGTETEPNSKIDFHFRKS